MYKLSILLFFWILLLTSCQEDSISLDEFELAEGFNISLVAGEAMVSAPVAMKEDIEGNIWVVEMPGYMRDIDGTGEDIADGRIVKLLDHNGDGRMDERQVVFDSLLNPRAICLVYGGVLYTDGNYLKWTAYDEQPIGETIIVDSIYVNGGNIEHQPNGLLYHLDNWIYSANSNARYQRRNGQWYKEVTTFRGQWGISMDSHGRMLYNNNALPLAMDLAMPNEHLKNKYLPRDHITTVLLTEDFRIYPLSATAVNRGYSPGVLDSLGRVKEYTSACAPLVYEGGVFPEEFKGSYFVCAPEGNLVASYRPAKTLLPPIAKRRYDEEKEFLRSWDETFRPVNLQLGYDGGLYIVDMRKGIIQHRAYMTNYLREKILNKKLEAVVGQGRIYKVFPVGYKEKSIIDRTAIELLADSNLSVRMWAQKKIVGSRDTQTVAELEYLAISQEMPAAVHALWCLEGLQRTKIDLLLELANKSKNPNLLWHLCHIINDLDLPAEKERRLIEILINKDMDVVNFAISPHIASYPDLKTYFLSTKKQKIANDSIMTEAFLSGYDDDLMEKYQKGRVDKTTYFDILLDSAFHNYQNENVLTPVLANEPFKDRRTAGYALFKSYCAACHGLDGKGQKKMAPSLIQSDFIQGPEVDLVNIILHGYQSGRGEYNQVMPAYKNDPSLDNEDIQDLIIFLKNAMTTNSARIKIESIDSLRRQ